MGAQFGDTFEEKHVDAIANEFAKQLGIRLGEKSTQEIDEDEIRKMILAHLDQG